MSLPLIEAEQSGPAQLAVALRVATPDSWPPEFFDGDDLRRMVGLLAEPANAGWGLYYLLAQARPPALVGIAGYAGRPDAQGGVEVGYSILPPYRRQGLATEALATLVAHAWREPSVQVVAADTYPTLPGSIGVLRRNGFQSVPSLHEGTLRFELRRADARAISNRGHS